MEILVSIMQNRENNKQEKQFDEFSKAKELVERNQINQAISILENIAYNQVLLIRNASPIFLLAKLYFKNGFYDKCWKLLNKFQADYKGFEKEIRNYQSRISKKENRPLDALSYRLMYNLYLNRSVASTEKDLLSYIKAANLLAKKDLLMNMFIKYFNKSIKNGAVDEEGGYKEYKKIIKT